MKSFNEVALKELEQNINRYLYHANGTKLTGAFLPDFKLKLTSEVTDILVDKVTMYITCGDTLIYKDFSEVPIEIGGPDRISNVCVHLEESFIGMAVSYFLTKMAQSDELTRAVIPAISHKELKIIKP